MRQLIEAIANRIAIKLKEANPEETASIEVMKYALFGILHNTVTLATAFLVGLVLDQFFDTFIAAVSFMLLRLVSGGYHFKTPLSCLIFSASIFVIIPLIPTSEISLFLLNILSLLLVILLAPSNIREHIRIPEKYFPLFKVISIVLVISSFFVNSPIITLAFFMQALTLITKRR